MAITNFGQLKTAIGNWLNRDDLADFIPDFVTLFETTAQTELNLRTRSNLTSSTLTTSAGAATVALPSDFLEQRALVPQFLDKTPLDYYTPAALFEAFPQLTNGQPGGFTIVGANAVFAPTPDSAYAYTLYYFQKVTALTTDSSTNWLLTNYPGVYLFGSLIAAEAFLKDDPRIAVWGNLYDNLLQKLGGSDERGQYGANLQAKLEVVA